MFSSSWCRCPSCVCSATPLAWPDCASQGFSAPRSARSRRPSTPSPPSPWRISSAPTASARDSTRHGWRSWPRYWVKNLWNDSQYFISNCNCSCVVISNQWSSNYSYSANYTCENFHKRPVITSVLLNMLIAEFGSNVLGGPTRRAKNILINTNFSFILLQLISIIVRDFEKRKNTIVFL